MKPRILLIGKSAYILRRLSRALEQQGRPAAWSRGVEPALAAHNPADYDLVVTGRGIQLFDKKFLKDSFLKGNPAIRFIDGLAPVIPLLVDQVKLAWTSLTESRPRFNILGFDRIHKSTRMRFQVPECATLSLDLYRLGMLYRTHRETLTLDSIAAGHHEIMFPASLFGKAQPHYIVVKQAGEVLAVQQLP